MEGYLGDVVCEQHETEFKDYTKYDWALYFIESYGQIDGAHHKDWVLDQAVRCLKGTPVIIEKASWSNGQSEYRISTADEPSEEYLQWVIDMKDGEDGPETYGYDEGIAP